MRSRAFPADQRPQGRLEVSILLFFCALVVVKAVARNAADANSELSCSAIVCTSSCASLAIPNDMPTYSAIGAALAAVPQGCGEQTAFLIFLSPVEQFLADLTVPASVSNLQFRVFHSNNQSIPFSKPHLGRIISTTSNRLQLSLDHLVWVSNASTAPSCLGVSSNPLPVDLSISDTEIECELPPLAYGQLQFVSSSISCSMTSGNCPLFQPASIATLFRVHNTSFGGSVEAPLLERAEFRSTEHSIFHGHLTLHAIGEEATIHASSTTFEQYVYLQTLWTDEAAESEESGQAMAGLPGLEVGTAMAGLVHTAHVEGAITTVNMQYNTFMDQLMVEGDYLSLTFYHNMMKGTSNLELFSAPQTLTLKSTCSVSGQFQKNQFSVGAVYLSIPSASARIKANCPEISNIYSGLSIKYNHFTPWMPVRANASVSVSFGLGYAIPRAIWRTLTIDVSQNWWGDATGPKLCCNPTGKGGYSTQLLRPDYWCLNPDCTEFSDVSLDEQCVTTCCSQKLSGGFIALIVILSVVTFGVLAAGSIVSGVHVRRHFRAKAFQYGQKEDLIERLVPTLYISCAASLLGAIGTIALLALIASLYSYSGHAPRQERLPVLAIVLCSIFAWLAFAQLVSNVLFMIALYLRKKHPKMLNFLSSKQFVLNGFQVAYMMVIGIVWGPYSSTVDTVCHSAPTLKLTKLSLTYWAEFDSGFSSLTTICLLPLVFIAAVVMIPQNTLNNLLYRFEYASITYALEAALLDDLARSPQVAQKAKYVRISAAVSLITAAANLVAAIYLLATPPGIPVDAALWPFTFMVWGSPRFINYLGCCIVGILLMIASIWTTFSYNRPLVLLVLTFSTALVAIGVFDTNLFEFAGAYYLRTDKTRAFLLRGTVQALGTLLIVAFTATFIFLYKLGAAVVQVLPGIAISNLNSHLDDSWHSSTSMKSSLLSETEKSEFEN